MKVTREQATQNRERIVEAAAQLFRERGFDGIGGREPGPGLFLRNLGRGKYDVLRGVVVRLLNFGNGRRNHSFLKDFKHRFVSQFTLLCRINTRLQKGFQLT